jgi:diguanylate cyclase (GGDEF)-like protein
VQAIGQFVRAVKDLERLTTDMTQREIVQRGVDIAQIATASTIAYLHFLNEDQNTIELGVWSHDTLAGCRAVYARHYPIESAGIWADSVRSRAPCIHNDYETQAGKRGLPDGHSRLIRHLGLPVIEDGAVRMLIGVGNKETQYDKDDVELLDTVARRIWSVTRQRRVLERFLDLGQRFRHVQELASVCGLEYDVDEDRLAFDDLFASIFRTSHATETPSNLHEFLSFVAPADHERVRAAFSGSSRTRQILRIDCHRRSGEHFPAELKVEFRSREVGSGVICVGILQDVSDEVVAEELRHRADSDPLTGLPNRHRLNAWFKQGLGRRGTSDRFAFHYIDLDEFKPVNDTRGHQVGDEVLRVIAQRLLQAVRKDDLVVRMGGDEFVVVQTGIENRADVRVLAEKILSAIGAPIPALGRPIEVGASIGIALGASGDRSLKELSADADHALYQAKAAGGRRYVVAAPDEI